MIKLKFEHKKNPVYHEINWIFEFGGSGEIRTLAASNWK
jgi:hypothetical protein